MDPRSFEEVARDELSRVPPRFAHRIRNVAILIEDAPSAAVCREEGLGEGETLLGLYHGVPANGRGIGYGGILPDTITLFRLPLLEEAEALWRDSRAPDLVSAVRLAVRETLWHELGHHFGLSEGAVEAREAEGTNGFSYAQGGRRVGRRHSRRSIMGRAFRPAGRVTGLTSSMAKTLALISGVTFVLIGLLGFVANPLVGTGAFFEADMAHDLVHLALGLVLLAVGLFAPARAALWLKVVGVIYLAIAALGFILMPGMGMLLGIMSVNMADHWLHIVFGAMLLAAGFMDKGESGSTNAMGSVPPPAPPIGQAT